MRIERHTPLPYTVGKEAPSEPPDNRLSNALEANPWGRTGKAKGTWGSGWDRNSESVKWRGYDKAFKLHNVAL